jgi:hypothetical protein
MTLDINTTKKLKPKRNRKLPRREILDADFVAPSSNRAIDDLLLDRTPSQHDRVILSELWGGNAANIDKNRMPAVSIGKPKRSLNNDSATKPKTYKDMLQEKHKDDWEMDLSNLTFVPSTAKGKHIRSQDKSTTPPAARTSEKNVSEENTHNSAELDDIDKKENAIDHKLEETDNKTTDKPSQIECSDAGNHKELDASVNLTEDNSTYIDNIEQMPNLIDKKELKSTESASGVELTLQDTNNIDVENHTQSETSQISLDKHDKVAERTEDMSETSTDITIIECITDEDEIDDYGDLDRYSECAVDQNLVEKLQELPVIDRNSGDLIETEKSPTIDQETPSKEENIQEQTTETCSNSKDNIDQLLVPEEACADVSDENDRHQTKLKHLEVQPIDLISSNTNISSLSKEENEEELKGNIPLNKITEMSINDDDDEEEEEDQQPYFIFLTPASRNLSPSTSKSRFSRKINDKMFKEHVQEEKPLLNLDPPISITKNNLNIKQKIIERWQRNQKKHGILEVLKSTNALDWVENGKDDCRKKEFGYARKRQLESKLEQPFIIKKRIKNCWFSEG